MRSNLSLIQSLRVQLQAPLCPEVMTVQLLRLIVLAGKAKDGKMKGEEVALVQSVTAVGTDGMPGLKKANVVLRIPRPPYIGDKFSSRHGQKGVLSQHYRDADMPFCAATGMR